MSTQTTTGIRTTLVRATLLAAMPLGLGCDGQSAPAAAVTPVAAPVAAPVAPPPPAASPAAPNQTRKPRQYKLVLPTVFPGAMIEFPPLGEFVQGEKRRSFPKDKIMVFEFFSTTCGHCAEAAPAIEALVDEYMPKGWEFISVTSEDAQKVRDWLAKPEIAEMVKQSVALDPASKAQKALQDRTFQVLTPRFFVVRNGLVLWYGHPDAAEEPFQKIADGSWNPESVRQEFIDNALVARARNQTGDLLRKCEADGKWDDLFELFESIAVAIPSRASTFELQKFGTMIGPANMTQEGYAYGRELAVKYATDIASLRTLARTTLNSPQVKIRDIDWAFTIAKQADELGKNADARAAEIMALAYFSKGDRDNAVKNMERAITLQDNLKAKKLYMDQLAKYRTDEPKPVPYTPPAPKPGTAPAAPAPGGTPAAPPAATDTTVDGTTPH